MVTRQEVLDQVGRRLDELEKEGGITGVYFVGYNIKDLGNGKEAVSAKGCQLETQPSIVLHTVLDHILRSHGISGVMSRLSHALQDLLPGCQGIGMAPQGVMDMLYAHQEKGIPATPKIMFPRPQAPRHQDN